MPLVSIWCNWFEADKQSPGFIALSHQGFYQFNGLFFRRFLLNKESQLSSHKTSTTNDIFGLRYIFYNEVKSDLLIFTKVTNIIDKATMINIGEWFAHVKFKY